MSDRRISLTGYLRRIGNRVIATAQGLAGEEFETEVFEPYGFSANPAGGDAILQEINGDANNHISGPPIGVRTAEDGSTLIYQGDTSIVLTPTAVTISTEGVVLTISDGCIQTTADIKTTGDVFAGLTSLRNHFHTAPDGPTSPPTV